MCLCGCAVLCCAALCCAMHSHPQRTLCSKRTPRVSCPWRKRFSWTLHAGGTARSTSKFLVQYTLDRTQHAVRSAKFLVQYTLCRTQHVVHSASSPSVQTMQDTARSTQCPVLVRSLPLTTSLALSQQGYQAATSSIPHCAGVGRAHSLTPARGGGLLWGRLA